MEIPKANDWLLMLLTSSGLVPLSSLDLLPIVFVSESASSVESLLSLFSFLFSSLSDTGGVNALEFLPLESLDCS